MNNLTPFIPDNCKEPVALVSNNLPEWIKEVINNNWDETSSGFGKHYSINELISIQDQELIDEYNEEYANANAW